jgi:hypothetical protein
VDDVLQGPSARYVYKIGVVANRVVRLFSTMLTD